MVHGLLRCVQGVGLRSQQKGPKAGLLQRNIHYGLGKYPPYIYIYILYLYLQI